MRVLAFTVLLFACSGTAVPGGGRYVMQKDPGSRHDFTYVWDSVGKQWVQRDCELRVSAQRGLPEPLNDPQHGNTLSVQVFRPISVGSAAMSSLEYTVRDGYRIWRIAQSLHEEDLSGRVAYGIQLKWPQPEGPADVEPLELIRLPPLGNTPPNEWSEWMNATDLRPGAFGWWEEAHQRESAPAIAPEHPFEMRCRLLWAEIPGRLP
jgi:hypothetical protein